MAISITLEPDELSAAYRPVVWKCTSNDPDIVRVIAEVKIDGTIRASIDKDPDLGETDEFTFDVQEVLKDYLTHDLVRPIANDVQDASSSEVSVLLEFHEVLDTTANTLSTTWEPDGTGAGTPSSAIVAINATLQHEETQNLAVFEADTSSGRYLTNSPSTQRISRTETATLHFVTNEASVKVRLIQFDSGDNIVATTAFPVSAQVIASQAGIIEIDASTIGLNASYFTIQLVNGINSVLINEVFRFNIDEQCRDNEVRLKWLNPLGGMDQYTFTAKKQEEIRFRSSTFEKVVGKGFSVEDRGDTVLSVNATDHIDIFSQSEPSSTISWLQEIGLGSQVLVDDGTNFIPYIVTSRKAKVLDTENNIMTIRFKLKKSNKRSTQRN